MWKSNNILCLSILSILFTLTMAPADSDAKSLQKGCSRSDTGIAWEKTRADLEMLPDKIADQAFRFQNTSGEPVTIKFAKASCSCTIPSYSTNIFKPGEYGIIKTSISSSGRIADFHASIVIEFSSGALFTLDNYIKIIGAPIFSSHQIVWDDGESEKSKKLTIDMSRSKNTTISSLGSTSKDYSLCADYNSQEEKWNITITRNSPNAKPAVITIETESLDRKTSYYVLLSSTNKTKQIQ